MAIRGVSAHPEDLGTRRHKILVSVAELTGFSSTDGCAVFGVEEQHDPFLAEELTQTHRDPSWSRHWQSGAGSPFLICFMLSSNLGDGPFRYDC